MQNLNTGVHLFYDNSTGVYNPISILLSKDNSKPTSQLSSHNSQDCLQHQAFSGKEALQTQLKHQGFNVGDEIWIKVNNNIIYSGVITPDGLEVWKCKQQRDAHGNAIQDPKGGSVWVKGKHYPDGYTHLRQRSEQGDEIFYIPNHPKGGIGAGHCERFNKIFCECDDRSIPEQWELLKEVSQNLGIVPNTVVYSGGKSLHVYYKLSVDITLEEWLRLQRQVIILFNSDKSIQNANREMRLAGFARSKKGTEQTLELASNYTYSFEELSTALDKTGKFPYGLSDTRWSDWRTHGDKVLTLPEDELPTNVERAKQYQKTQKRRVTGIIGTTNLVDLIEQTSQRLGEDAFNWPGHNWKARGSKLRGCCPWHESTTGTAGWVAPMKNGGWGYACPTCTGNRQINAFRYWLGLKTGSLDNFPTGKQWVDHAKEFLADFGVPVPEFSYANDEETRDCAERSAKGNRIISREEWEEESDADIDEEIDIDEDEEEEIDSDEEANEQLTFVQKVYQQLYSDSHWICVNEKLYKWENTYYKLHTDGEEKKRIQQWCNSYAVIKSESSDIRLKVYPYAEPRNVTSALEWAKQALYIHPDAVNQAGINCLNGILQITWDGDKPAWELVDHDPTKHYFTYPPLVEYNPKADSYHCDRLLDALDPAQRDIFLKVIAASIDLPNVRRFKGRLIRALLLKGTGANGKDALKEAIATIFGKQGMTSCTLNDFQQYDDGRRFPLSNLAFSRINWASENTNSSRLDRVQSLKAAITGNTLTAEAKGKDGQDFTPNAVFLFNINDVPSLQGALEAILSRYAVISFNKTYKVNADPTKGELEADPRFAYDPLFLKTMVCPALLNKMLDALERLMREGIDYDCTKQALQDIQAENSHLWQFIQETGMGYAPNCYLSTDDIWQRLKPWYIDTGTLTFSDSGKEVWADQVRPSDKNVKALNQVLTRFKQLFPQAKQASIMHPSGKKKIPVLQGVAFGVILNKDFCTAISENSTPIPPQKPPQENLTQQALHPNHPNSSNTAGKNIENDLVTEPKPPDILQNIAQNPNQTSFEQCSNSKKENENLENWGGWGGTLENTGKIGVEDWGGGGVEDTLIAVPNDLLRIDPEKTQVAQEAMNDPSPRPSTIPESPESLAEFINVSAEANAEANAKLLREARADGDWDLISTLTEDWTPEFKKEVWGYLNDTEKAALKQIKHQQQQTNE